MKPVFLEVLAINLIFSNSQGNLIQTIGKDIICPDNVAVFWCSSDELTFINLEVRTRTGVGWPSFINSNNPVGSTINGTLNSSLLSVLVISNNNSVVTVNLTITSPINLNESVVQCNGQMVILNVPTKFGTTPTIINISKNESSGLLYFNWTSEERNYCLKVSEISEHWSIVTKSSYSIPLINTTSEIYFFLNFNANISHFIIDSCISYDKIIPQRNYTLNLNRTWTILQICDDLTLQFATTCSSSGTWTKDFRCPTMTINNVSAFPECVITTGSGNTTTNKYVEIKTSTVFVEDNTFPTQVIVNMSTILVVASSTVTFVITLIIGIISGFLCGSNYKKCQKEKTTSEKSHPVSEENVTGSTSVPIYEEMELENRGTIFTFNQNMAYEQVKKEMI